MSLGGSISSLRLVVPLLSALALGCESSPGLRIAGPIVHPILPGDSPRVLNGRSTAFLDGRPFWIYLPPSYYTSTAEYPVLYMLDGDELFAPKEPSWHADDIADSLITTGAMAPIIIVGIANGGTRQRIHDYSPWPDSSYNGPGPGGGGDAFLYALRAHLKPLIDGHFRTLNDPSNTYLAGASLGGLLAVYGGYTYSSTFGRVAAFSPSYWWADVRILTHIRQQGRGALQRIYHDTATRYDISPISLELVRDIAIEQGFRDSIDILTVVAPCGLHSYEYWRRRLPIALQFISSRAVATTAPARRAIARPMRLSGS